MFFFSIRHACWRELFSLAASLLWGVSSVLLAVIAPGGGRIPPVGNCRRDGQHVQVRVVVCRRAAGKPVSVVAATASFPATVASPAVLAVVYVAPAMIASSTVAVLPRGLFVVPCDPELFLVDTPASIGATSATGVPATWQATPAVTKKTVAPPIAAVVSEAPAAPVGARSEALAHNPWRGVVVA